VPPVLARDAKATPPLSPLAALLPGVFGNCLWWLWSGSFDLQGCLIGLSPAWLTFGTHVKFVVARRRPCPSVAMAGAPSGPRCGGRSCARCGRGEMRSGSRGAAGSAKCSRSGILAKIFSPYPLDFTAKICYARLHVQPAYVRKLLKCLSNSAFRNRVVKRIPNFIEGFLENLIIAVILHYLLG
jgi:hypothetical protein